MRVSIPLLSLLVLWPLAAQAQATSFTTYQFADGTKTASFNLEECDEDASLAVNWQLNAALAEGQELKAFLSSGEDCASPTSGEALPQPAQNATSLELSVLQLVEDCSPVEDEQFNVCLWIDNTTGNDLTTTPLVVTVDTEPPAAPDTLSAQGGDRSLEVEWSYSGTRPADVEGYKVLYAPVGGELRETGTVQVTRTRVTGLENGVEYEVQVVALDDVGNESEASEPVLATPIPSDDFWEVYRGAGGEETGGCSSASGTGALLPGVLLLGLALAFRRRRAGAGLLVLALLLPAAAQARPWVDPDRAWFFELSAGPYYPAIDDEFGGEGPYETVFGTDATLLTRLRVERAIWQGFGQVGVGLGVGYGRERGTALLEDGSASNDRTTMHFIPLQLTATYRFDWLALEYGVPIALFGRAGLVYEMWRITDNTGAVAGDGEGNEGQGGRTGWTYGGGAMLLLDVIDPRLARDFQRSTGVDNTYLFFEWVRLEVDGLDGSAGFDLSDTTWSAGLALEF